MDIILAWMQGSWKWTQWKLISQKFWHKIFETWKELRKLRDSWSELWNKIKERIDNWHLVDTVLIMEIVQDFLKNTSEFDNVIFDWLPRNLEQYNAFHKVMKANWRHARLFHIALSKEDALKRLLWRFECTWVDTTNNPLITKEECRKLWWSIKIRDDDTEEAINKRLDIFFSETLPIIEQYKDLWKYFEINWIQSVNKVFEEIEKILH
jgi:adenylate kinase